jgi:hypothetical protein
MRNPNNKHQLVIEPQTALVVKRIFNLYISGYSSSSIAELLTKEKVSTPIMVKNREKSLLKYDYYYIWKSSSINNILKNRCYIGELIQHKSQNINYKVKKRKKVPKNEWCIIENAHEAIISKDIFDIVQSLRNKKNNYNINRRNVEYILSDLVYCKDCGAKMSISYDKKRDRISMNCNNYRKYSKYDICSSHFINYNILKRMIFNKISLLSSIYINNIDEFKKIILNKYSNPTTELNKKINFLKIENEKIKCKQDSLYDDKFNNIISLETYERLFKKYENDININNDKILNYELELSKISSNSNIYDDYTNIIEDYLYMKNPTKETLNKLIEKIYITKDKKIEIHYRIKQSEVLV